MIQLESQFVKLRRWFSDSGEKDEPSAGFFPPRIREKAKQLCLQKRGNLLEVGCGEGLFLRELAKSSPLLKITGIDSWPEILEQARRKIKGLKRVEITYGEATGLPFDKEYFTTVTCLNMLYNLPSKEKVEEVLTEMGRVCKRGGSLIFDVRNRRSPLFYFGYKLVKYYDSSCPWPLRTYRIEEICEILERLNFRILKEIPIGFPLRWLAPVLLVEAVKE